VAVNLSQCPAGGDLERLLAEQLSGPERDGIETHVEGCPSCQEQLARLSSGNFRPVPSSPAAREESDAGPHEGFRRRLREMPPPTAVPGGEAPLFPKEQPASPPHTPWLEQQRLGQYEILEKLGAGGMGTVYLARHVELGKVMALKVLPAGQVDEVSVARFKNEIRAIGRLDHPHIVAAHDAGEFRGVHYLVMDFVDGVDLAGVLRERGSLRLADACEAIRQAALALQHAHERGLVHRDIKPSNLMLARGGIIKLLDLGVARSFGDAPAETLTAKRTLLGTADYLAPEQ
jgi:serine/threonine protein kinase